MIYVIWHTNVLCIYLKTVFKGPGVRKWTLSIDDVKPVEENIIPGLTNVTILNKKAYFGGRPG